MSDRSLLKFPITRIPRTDLDWNNYIRTLERYVAQVAIYSFRLGIDQLPMSATGNVGSVQSGLALTVTDRGGSLGSQINISAHTCQYSSDLIVSYGAGTLTADDTGTDLPYSTNIAGGDYETFYVYVDNPTYANQASPVYKATSNAQDLVDEEGRYRVGTVIMVQEGLGDTYGGGGGGGGVTGDFTVTNHGDIIP